MRRAHIAASRTRATSLHLIGNAATTTIPTLKGIPCRFCSRWDQQPAAALGKSLLRLGICQPEDWTGNAVDFVERGFQRFCKENGSEDASEIWQGTVWITDSLFRMSELEYYNSRAETDAPADALFLLAEYEAAASIPIQAALMHLEREDPLLPSAFYFAFVYSLYPWMRVYDYTDACFHAEMMMEDLGEEELKESFYPQIAPSVPKCLPPPSNATSGRSVVKAAKFLKKRSGTLRRSAARNLVQDVLEMYSQSKGKQHRWPSQLAEQIPGLEDFLSDADDCGPGCAITWHEDDAISAAFDDEMQYLGQNAPMQPCMLLRIRLKQQARQLDKEVRQAFDHVGAMLRSLRVGARIVSRIRELNDEHLREHRKKSGLQAQPCPAGIRNE
ncbi:MAG TPA: hypothetical protein VFP59_19630 [Candidatus Angelobacter sp.]|nr:hypothetical protein [Candidatus Angelobacter sp.]